MAIDLKQYATSALERMNQAGFDSAQVAVSVLMQDELNIANNEASLLRSTEDYTVSLIGIIDGRNATTTLSELNDDAIAHGVQALYDRTLLAPQDEANAVSRNQEGHFEQGPQKASLDVLVRKTKELLEFRGTKTPRMTLEEGRASHGLFREQVLTSEGTDLSCSTGCYSLSAFGTASDGDKCSSFNVAGGNADDISGAHATEYFGIGEMLQDTERQIDTRALDGNFVGEVILAPGAVSDLLGWLLGQLGDRALISDASLYKHRTGEQIASPLLTIQSRFDGPGDAPYSSDAFVANPITLVSEGTLGMLLPSYYGSLKTGIAHTPVGDGWRIDPGATPKDELIGSVEKGALVTRLSMGEPSANGDFSAVIKNSFLIENGEAGTALAETMITGNMARMLKDISGISREHLDTGSEDFPWIRIPNLHFS
ncbi:MAG: metallopeptidase TldD-related protein [Pseudomonadales bacterium]